MSPFSAARRGVLLLAVVAITAAVLVGAPVLDDAPAWAGVDAGVSVDILDVRGTLDPPVVGAISDLLERAEARGGSLVVLQIDAEAAVAVEGAELARKVASSPVPVAVWVGPGQARAVGASVFLPAAAHVTALAGAATVGPACPLTASERCPGPQVIAADLAAVDGSAADWRDVVGGELTATSAEQSGHADLVVEGLEPLLVELDGREVETVAGTVTLRLRSDELTVRLHKLGLLRRMLHVSLAPTLLYMMLVAVLLLAAFELFQPGFGVAGVAALLVAPLLVYGLVVLPIAWWALALLVLGVALLAVDLAIAGLGLPSLFGTAAFLLGSRWLFGTDTAFLSLPGWLLGLVTAFVALFFVVIMTVVLRAQAGPDAAGAAEDIVDQLGVVRSTLNPEGHVFVAGALWRGRSGGGERVRTGQRVRVTGVDGAVLVVEQVEAATSAERSGS